jgi:inner membrane protein YidH
MEGKIPESETLSREHLANERTLLSWVRTGLSAINVGILLYVAGRVLGVLYEGSLSRSLPTLASRQEEFAFLGAGMVVFGVFVQLAAVARFFQYKASISRGTFTSSAPVYLLIILGLILLSVAYIIYVLVG